MNCELMSELQRVSFAMDELRLFIDTHPNNTEAIDLFNGYAEKRRELAERYNSEVSPLTGYDREESGYWRWGENSAWKGGYC